RFDDPLGLRAAADERQQHREDSYATDHGAKLTAVRHLLPFGPIAPSRRRNRRYRTDRSGPKLAKKCSASPVTPTTNCWSTHLPRQTRDLFIVGSAGR